jgi:hypothetical protein
VSATLFDLTYSQDVLALPNGVDNSCSRSFVPDRNSNDIPCLLTASYFVLSFASGLTGLYLYTYLIKNIEKDMAALFRGDLNQKLIENVEKLSSSFLAVMIFIVVPVGTSYACFSTFTTTTLASNGLSAIILGNALAILNVSF